MAIMLQNYPKTDPSFQTFNPLTDQYPGTSKKNNKTEQVAAGVGGAAGISASATQMAGKRGLTLQKMMAKVTSTAEKVTQNTEKATTLWGKFKNNTKIFTKDILARYKALENSKFIGAIVKNPIVKKSASVFGGGLAFFVLITGVNKAAGTYVDAAGDIKKKVQTIRTAA